MPPRATLATSGPSRQTNANACRTDAKMPYRWLQKTRKYLRLRCMRDSVLLPTVICESQNGWERDLDCDDEGYLRGTGGRTSVTEEAGAGVALVDGREGHATYAEGSRIRIGGLGTLEVRKREARTGRNPATGGTMQIAASKKVAFRPAKELAWISQTRAESGRRTRPSSGILVVRSNRVGRHLTRFAARASDNFWFPVMRVHQGARQHGDEQAWCFRRVLWLRRS